MPNGADFQIFATWRAWPQDQRWIFQLGWPSVHLAISD